MNAFHPLRILYLNVIENNAGWGAEWFVNRGFQVLGHQTHCIDFRKYRQDLPARLAKAPPYDIFFLQRGDYFPLPLIAGAHAPRLFWASELVERCRDQDPLLQSGLFDHIFFHSQRCIDLAGDRYGLERARCSVLLNGFDETIHKPLPNTCRDIDVLFVGVLTERRRILLERLKDRFALIICQAFGTEMVRLFNRAKIVLNLHAAEFPDVETRIFEALGCGAFLLSERLSKENPFDQNHLVEFDTSDELREKLDYYLEHTEERETIAVQGHDETLARHTYTHRAREIAEIMSAYLKKTQTHATAGSDTKKDQPESVTVKTVAPKKKHQPLHIFAAFSQNNWEDYNLQPALESLGEVVRYDWKGRFDQYDPQWHFGLKQKMNLELMAYFYQGHRQKPFDLFFSYVSGRLVFPAFIRTINRLGVPSLNICLDDKTKFYGELEPTGYAGMADIASCFSLCWTTELSALAQYASVGAHAVYMPAGANPDIFRPLDLPKIWDVVFIGQKYGRRGLFIEQLREHGIKVQTYGAGWENGPVSMTEMVRLFNQSKIVLGMGLINDSSEQVALKGRDFEVPMCGALYITHDNQDLREFYAFDQEIVCFQSLPDLADKIKYYLAHPQEAETLRQAALKRSRREHTWTHRFQKALKIMGLLENDPGVDSQTYPAAPVTRDDWTYYQRGAQKGAAHKKETIKAFILAHPEIRSVLDVGCNTGEMSAPFLDHGLEVLGLDASSDLRLRENYPFLACDITACDRVILKDAILFLSLYHHLFRSQGRTFADNLFYKLLLRSRYLIFDCGNPDETGPDREGWARVLKDHFASEKELLDHFSLPYEIIGTWPTGGTQRSIVVFQNRAFDEGAQIVDEFRRRPGSHHQKQGLTSVKEIKDPREFFDQTHFFKLRLGGKYFFAKKHRADGYEASELQNIQEVYEKFPAAELIDFFGCSARFGLIFAWLEHFTYLSKVRNQYVHGVLLHDADRLEINGQIKYIDFWSDPLKK